MATGTQILDDLTAAYEKLDPTIWYTVSELVPSGKWLRTAATEFFPEVHHFHPDNWAQIHRELTDAGMRLRDFRGWRPEGATRPTIIEGTVI